ncbi:protein FAM117A isoform X2 [Scleropages formosus]|uniref:protein FAM117A isoform X2 n=1 Tax=Scleropages formosus TaxID=113540 RepID=UPI00087848BF|nr:protein FAM117A isoform X2 [Scleropages formosus]
MSCVGCAGRGRASGLQPIRATVQFQLHGRTPREAKTVEKTKSRPPKPSIRRTLSLETVVGPYLQGRWPKEPDSHSSCVNDKATQTPSSWCNESRSRRSGGHKRSASWGSADHLREISNLKHQLQKRSKHSPRGGPERDCPSHHSPGGYIPGTTQTTPFLSLSRLTPRLRHSVEGLNLELEGVFVSGTPQEQRSIILDVPDGHRAPVPSQRCSSESQSNSSPAPLDPALLSPSPSPCPMEDVADTLCPSPSPPLVGIGSSPLPMSSSPCPRKISTFQREPPEGCERVRACEEALTPSSSLLLTHPLCPDPNKVNFTPHGGSAFCPVSLLKPLLPSVDFLFRSLSVSPVTSCPPTNTEPGVGTDCNTTAAM